VTRRRHSHRSGAATLEFAIVAPLVFLFFFAAFEYSRFSSIRHSAHLAAFEGARRGIVPGATSSDVQASAATILDATRIHGATIAVEPSAITNRTPAVTVKVSVPIADNTWVPLSFLTGAQFEAECTLERETI
jgi:Flp pilus assembly protein TadG